jgi:hypothetical protein
MFPRPVVSANLFHFKVDQTKYNIMQEDYGKKPMIPRRISPTAATRT